MTARLLEERFEREAVARSEELAPLRTAVARHAQALGASAEVVEKVRLAVSEALSNVVMHAYVDMPPGSMSVQAWLDEDEQHLTIRVLDNGRGLVPRTDSPGLGLGFGLMAQMADDFRVANREGTPGTTISMRFSFGGSAYAPSHAGA